MSFRELGVCAEVGVQVPESVYCLGFVDEGGENALLFATGFAIYSVEPGGFGGEVEVAGDYDDVAEASETVYVFCDCVEKGFSIVQRGGVLRVWVGSLWGINSE